MSTTDTESGTDRESATRTDADGATGTNRTDTNPGTGDRLLDALQGVLGLAFLLVGGLKLAGVDSQIANFERWGYPQWFRLVTGSVEVAGGLGLLAGRRLPVAGLLGGSLTLGTMLGALYTHFVRVADPPSEAAPASVLLALAALVTGRQLRSGGRNDWATR